MMVSHVSNLLDQIDSLLADDSAFSSTSQNKYSSGSSYTPYSANNLDNILDFESDEADQIEANLLINALGGKRFFSIDNHTLEQLPQSKCTEYITSCDYKNNKLLPLRT